MPQEAFLMRRLENVRGAFSLSALAYIIKRAFGFGALTALAAMILSIGALLGD